MPLVFAALLAACGGDRGAGALAAPHVGPASSSAPALRYEVAAGPGARELAVEAAFPAGLSAELSVDEGCEPFVRDVVVDAGSGAHSLSARRGSWFAEECAARGCIVRYRYLLGEAAAALDDLDRARVIGAAIEAPPSTYLLHPLRMAPGLLYRAHVTVPAGVAFVSGVPPAKGAPPNTIEADVRDLPMAPFSAFGALRVHHLEVPGGAIDVAITPSARALDDRVIVDWANQSARAVAGYYGRFPVDHALVLVMPTGGRHVGQGETMGDGGASIAVAVGDAATQTQLDRDWVLTHEMIHLTFPTMERRHHWIEEGISTYVEPLARVRIGRLDADDVWRDMIEGLPHGLPEQGDEGLDNTPTWGRTYWGGALFCFVADVEIREKTNNAKSLEDALRGILAAGGNGSVHWSLAKALEEGDRALGAPFLTKLHARMGDSPAPVDLDALFTRLGVRVDHERVIYDDHAPLASVRRAILGR